MNYSQKNTSRGFTLIELLTVIAIIGVLAALVFPAIGNALSKATNKRAQSNLRTIAQAYIAYQNSGTPTRNIIAADIPEWSGVLAVNEEIWDGKLYYIDTDPGIPATIPSTVGTISADKVFTADPAFLGQSVEVVSGLTKKGGTFPVVWSFGLKTDGTWDPADSAFEANEGIIAFTDGSAQFYEDGLKDAGGNGLLRDFTTKAATFNIEAAIGGGTIRKPTGRAGS